MDPITLYGALMREVRNPRHYQWLPGFLFVVDAALTAGIIKKVPYTEIDWTTYMQQVQLYIDGERDYDFIKGSTGPLVYPGLHLYLYRVLHFLTDGGTNIERAQWIFMGVYLAALGLVMACYRKAGAPPYLLPMLVLSKRLHSIFVLRLFNDCFVVLFLWGAIYAYQNRRWTLGSTIYACALGTKMSALLVLPGIGLVLLMARGRERTVTQLLVIGQLQILFAYQFISRDAGSYVRNAFDFGRVFMYKWTVNWKFVDEQTFLSKPFAISLLAAHVAVLALFTLTRWLRATGRGLEDYVRITLQEAAGPLDQRDIARRITPNYLMTIILTTNAIGMLFARSLHYQFYAWLAWTTPFLLYKAEMSPVLAYIVWAAQEYAWNVYPADRASSLNVVGALALQLVAVYFGTAKEYENVDAYAAPVNHGLGAANGQAAGPRVVEVDGGDADDRNDRVQ